MSVFNNCRIYHKPLSSVFLLPIFEHITPSLTRFEEKKYFILHEFWIEKQIGKNTFRRQNFQKKNSKQDDLFFISTILHIKIAD